MALIFSDDFNRADSTNIGSNYTELSGAFEIVSNELKMITHNSADDVVTYDPALGLVTAADYEAEVRAKMTVGGGGGVGVACRVTDINNYYMVEASPGGGNLDLYRKQSGGYNYKGGYAGGITTNVFYTVKLSVTGSAIKAYLAGVERISVTDSNLTSAGKPAIRGFSSDNGQTYDDFAIYGTPSTTDKIKKINFVTYTGIKNVTFVAEAALKKVDFVSTT